MVPGNLVTVTVPQGQEMTEDFKFPLVLILQSSWDIYSYIFSSNPEGLVTADDLRQFEVKSSHSGLLSAMVFNMETQVVQPEGLVTVNNLRQFMVKSSHAGIHSASTRRRKPRWYS